MRFEIHFTPIAVRDIEAVLTYTRENFGQAKYEQYKALIREALSHLATHPAAPPSKAHPKVRADARTLHLQRRGKPARHLFFYRIVDGSHVQIWRLLHDAMDFRQNLPEGFEAD